LETSQDERINNQERNPPISQPKTPSELSIRNIDGSIGGDGEESFYQE